MQSILRGLRNVWIDFEVVVTGVEFGPIVVVSVGAVGLVVKDDLGGRVPDLVTPGVDVVGLRQLVALPVFVASRDVSELV